MEGLSDFFNAILVTLPNFLQSILTEFVVIASVAVITWMFKIHRDKKDKDKIYSFMVDSGNNTKYTFRSTEAISSETKITESRVEKLCQNDKRIKRNNKKNSLGVLCNNFKLPIKVNNFEKYEDININNSYIYAVHINIS